MISALSNLAGTIPYQFGGDGAVALIPPGFADEARKVLARTRTFAKREFKLDLRVGFSHLAPLGTRLAAGQPMLRVHAASQADADEAALAAAAALQLADAEADPPPLIHDIVRA